VDGLKVAACLHVNVFSYRALNGWYVVRLRLKLFHVDNRIKLLHIFRQVVSE